MLSGHANSIFVHVLTSRSLYLNIRKETSNGKQSIQLLSFLSVDEYQVHMHSSVERRKRLQLLGRSKGERKGS